ncbi:short transient receptor potential channel 4-associated protein-like [Watersipora subatra]|uniref:short transient receptor potential channel 4-associated protein-like n=1 Tax=Watersipora subatra TaxID=2589382 RepID=UPI00355C3CB1
MEYPTEAKRRRICVKDNAVSKRIHTEQAGYGNVHLHQVELKLLERYGAQLEVAGIQTQHYEVLKIVTHMEEYLRRDSCSDDTLYKSFKKLYECVTCLDRQRHEQELSRRYKRECLNAELFYNLGGLQAAKRIMLLESQLPTESRHRQETEEKLRMKSVLFETMSRIITTESIGEKVAKELAEEEVLIGLFSYLKYDQTYISSCSLIEDLLQYLPNPILSQIPDMHELILELTGDKLINFCRILAIALSDKELHEKLSYAQKKEEHISVRELNQEYLLEIPHLVEQLVMAASSKDSLPRFRGIKEEDANWMQWIDDSNADDIFDLPDMDIDVEEFTGGITQPTEYDAPWCQQPSMTAVNRLIGGAAAVHVLGQLLVGKHQKHGQQVLADTKLVPGLSSAFENFIWVFQGASSEPRLPGRPECSPELVLKIQMMKLIHSLCDHSEYKHLLLTKGELAEVQRINDKAGVLAIEGLGRVNKLNMCKGKEGLLTKIVDTLKKEPTSLALRFWLVRIVESYLRGTASYCYQVFLLRRGLLQHVISNLLADESSRQEVIQSGFDLLAGLTVFNIEAFQVIDDILRLPQMRNKFVDLINKNLVDSHLFIRSVILSFNFFSFERTMHADYAKTKNYLLSYVGTFQQQMVYLRKLISIITAKSVSQENVGCLNTALVLLICSHKSTSMLPYLEALKNEQMTRGTECGSPVLANFRELLLFWQKHYSSRKKQCIALEKSSRIPFSEWQHIVKTLTNDDHTLPTSLVYYIHDLPT